MKMSRALKYPPDQPERYFGNILNEITWYCAYARGYREPRYPVPAIPMYCGWLVDVPVKRFDFVILEGTKIVGSWKGEYHD